MTRFASFDDYWEPLLTGQGSAPNYLATRDERIQTAIRDRLARGYADKSRKEQSKCPQEPGPSAASVKSARKAKLQPKDWIGTLPSSASVNSVRKAKVQPEDPIGAFAGLI